MQRKGHTTVLPSSTSQPAQDRMVPHHHQCATTGSPPPSHWSEPWDESGWGEEGRPLGDTRLEMKRMGVRMAVREARQQLNMVLDEGENAEVGLLDPERKQQKIITQMARNLPAQVGGETTEDSSSTSKWRAPEAGAGRKCALRGEFSANDTSS